MTNTEWRWWFIIFGFVGLLAMAIYLIGIAQTAQLTPEERRKEWVGDRLDTISCTEWRGLCLCLGKTYVYGAFAFEAPPAICGIERE